MTADGGSSGKAEVRTGAVGSADGWTFGDLLRSLRDRRGLSLRRLGRLVHYSHGYLWDLESGAKRPTEAVVAALDSALDAGGRLLTVAAYDPASPGNERSEGESGTSALPNDAVGAGHNVPVEVRVLVPGVAPIGDSAGVVVVDVGLVRVVVVTGASGTDGTSASGEPVTDAQVYSLAVARQRRSGKAG